jgi:hypothetical protein
MKSIRRFLGWSGAERGLVVQAALLLLAVRAALFILPFRTISRLASRLARSRGDTDHPDRVTRDLVVWAVTRVGRRLLGKDTCLPQALVGQVLLARNGFPARLQIGVRKDDDGELVAHAWVECRGDVVIGGPASLVRGYSSLRNAERIAAGRNLHG